MVDVASVGYVFDSGPLLCVGASKTLKAELLKRHKDQCHWVSAVRDELLRQGGLNGSIAPAARAVSGRNSGWLSPCEVFRQQDDVDVEPIHSRLKILASNKKSSRAQTAKPYVHPKANLGEAQTIVHAKRKKFYVLTNDRDALQVSGENNVPALTMLSFAKGLVGRGARPDTLAKELMDLRALQIDIGGTLKSVLDLQPRRKY